MIIMLLHYCNENNYAVVDCGYPVVPRNGLVQVTNTTFGSLASYSCDECSQLKGISPKQICGRDGLWLLPLPTCQGKM